MPCQISFQGPEANLSLFIIRGLDWQPSASRGPVCLCVRAFSTRMLSGVSIDVSATLALFICQAGPGPASVVYNLYTHD